MRAAAKAWGIPVLTVGVVEAGARGLAETRGDNTGAVAVLATNATCASKAYPKAIARLMPNAPVVFQCGSGTLAASIEGRSTILNAAPIQRAHPRFVENLNALGADVEWVAGD